MSNVIDYDWIDESKWPFNFYFNIAKYGDTCAVCGMGDLVALRYIVERALDLKGHNNNPFYPTNGNIIPDSKGGSRLSENMQLECWSCNKLKGNRDMTPELLEDIAQQSLAAHAATMVKIREKGIDVSELVVEMADELKGHINVIHQMAEFYVKYQHTSPDGVAKLSEYVV